MTDRIRRALGDLKARQDGGEHMPCPRCGRDTMKENVYSNALSRHVDIYICDACGTEESKRFEGLGSAVPEVLEQKANKN